MKNKFTYGTLYTDRDIEEIPDEKGQFFSLTPEEGFLTNIPLDRYEKALKAIGYL